MGNIRFGTSNCAQQNAHIHELCTTEIRVRATVSVWGRRERENESEHKITIVVNCHAKDKILHNIPGTDSSTVL